MLDDFKFLLREMGEDVFINGNETPTRVIITNKAIDGNKYNNIRNISSEVELNIGDSILWNDEMWAVTTSMNRRYEKYIANMRKCNLNPFYYKVGDKTYSAYGFYEKNVFTNNDNEAIVLPNDIVMVTIAKNEETEQIKKDDKFYIFENSWYEFYQIEGIDRSQGNLIIRAKEIVAEGTPQEYYDLETPTPTANIGEVLVTPDTLYPTLGDTPTLTAKVYDTEGEKLPDETVTWSSSDETIATVDNTGLVTTVKVGVCDIVATSDTDNTIFGKCELHVCSGGGWF